VIKKGRKPRKQEEQEQQERQERQRKQHEQDEQEEQERRRKEEEQEEQEQQRRQDEQEEQERQRKHEQEQRRRQKKQEQRERQRRQNEQEEQERLRKHEQEEQDRRRKQEEQEEQERLRKHEQEEQERQRKQEEQEQQERRRKQEEHTSQGELHQRGSQKSGTELLVQQETKTKERRLHSIIVERSESSSRSRSQQFTANNGDSRTTTAQTDNTMELEIAAPRDFDDYQSPKRAKISPLIGNSATRSDRGRDCKDNRSFRYENHSRSPFYGRQRRDYRTPYLRSRPWGVRRYDDHHQHATRTHLALPNRRSRSTSAERQQGPRGREVPLESRHREANQKSPDVTISVTGHVNETPVLTHRRLQELLRIEKEFNKKQEEVHTKKK